MNLDEMYTWWNESAKSDAMTAILSNRTGWDREAFFQTGVEWLQEHFSWAALAGFTPVGRSALDFGCGVGRMTNALAKHYPLAVGVDISDEMVRLAREYAGLANVRFEQAIGTPLTSPEKSFDFIYSTIVIQHIPAPFNEATIADLFRLCAPGGYVLFDAPSHKLRTSDREPENGIFLLPFESLMRLSAIAGLELLALRNFPATATRHYQYLFQRQI